MKKYSLSYNNINPNFVIDAEGDTRIEEPFNSFLSVCENILNRDVCVRPSLTLLSRYGDHQRYDRCVYSSSCMERPRWSGTIKGGDVYNPALSFYEDSLSSVLNDIFSENGDVIYRSFLPECRFDWIIKDTGPDFAVDFYSALLRLVIEIDGGQHSFGVQRQRDIERDRSLTNKGVRIYRISTSDIRGGRFRGLKDTLKGIEDISEGLGMFIDPRSISEPS